MDRILTQDEKDQMKPVFEYWMKKDKPVIEHYKEFSSKYDQLCDISGYVLVPKHLVDMWCSFIAEKDAIGKSIIDIACGTGFIGEELAKRGYKNIHGIDPCKDMLAECEKKGIYSRCFNVALTTEQTADIADNAYDVAFIAGGLLEDHIPIEALKEISRMVKPNGYILATLDYHDGTNFMEVIGTFMNEKVISLERMESIPFIRNMFEDLKWHNGIVAAFKVL